MTEEEKAAQAKLSREFQEEAARLTWGKLDREIADEFRKTSIIARFATYVNNARKSVT